MSAVSIVDYGIGNLLSVERAFTYFQVKTKLAKTAQDILAADRLVLPGVGAFADGMQGLQAGGLLEAISSFANAGKPLLGICLGMQMLLSSSMEFGHHLGLNLIEGKVVPIPTEGEAGIAHKIPHIGWSELHPTDKGPSWQKTILTAMPKRAFVYFVHSFMVVPDCPSTRLADTFYNGLAISAVIKKDNIYGCQFHPEKSGEVGLGIIREFMKL